LSDYLFDDEPVNKRHFEIEYEEGDILFISGERRTVAAFIENIGHIKERYSNVNIEF